MSSQDEFLKEMENWVNLYMNRSLSKYYDFLKSTNVSMHQAYALTFIHYNGPSKISDICEHMMVSAAATSQLVDRLEKQDLVQRTAAPGDRRVRNVVLSETGERFVQQSTAARKNWIKEIPGAVEEKQLDQITAALYLLNSIEANRSST